MAAVSRYARSRLKEFWTLAAQGAGHTLLARGVGSQPLAPAWSKEFMLQVTGIGGLFFRAKNPTMIAEWYRENLGVALVPADYSQKPWSQEAGPTVFAPFPEGSEYFGNAEKNWMVNFRVRDLDAMVEQLRAARIDVSVDPEIYPNGRFARLHDPEGNPIELWEPK